MKNKIFLILIFIFTFCLAPCSFASNPVSLSDFCDIIYDISSQDFETILNNSDYKTAFIDAYNSCDGFFIVTDNPDINNVSKISIAFLPNITFQFDNGAVCYFYGYKRSTYYFHLETQTDNFYGNTSNNYETLGKRFLLSDFPEFSASNFDSYESAYYFISHCVKGAYNGTININSSVNGNLGSVSVDEFSPSPFPWENDSDDSSPGGSYDIEYNDIYRPYLDISHLKGYHVNDGYIPFYLYDYKEPFEYYELNKMKIKLLVLETSDSGETWRYVDSMQVDAGAVYESGEVVNESVGLSRYLYSLVNVYNYNGFLEPYMDRNDVRLCSRAI